MKSKTTFCFQKDFPINCTVKSSHMLRIRLFYIKDWPTVWSVLSLIQSNNKPGLRLKYICALHGRDRSHE